MVYSVIAVYCRNGHRVGELPELLLPPADTLGEAAQDQLEGDIKRMTFCTECGTKTLSVCGACGASVGDPDKRPAYCGACGKPFPWTETALCTAREYADELELSVEDKTELKATLVDLTADTPRTPLAASRFKRIIGKVGPALGETLQKIIVDVVTDSAKKLMMGG